MVKYQPCEGYCPVIDEYTEITVKLITLTNANGFKFNGFKCTNSLKTYSRENCPILSEYFKAR